MQNVPKIVRERLRASNVNAPSTVHPDPDILTAFAERSLPNSEREVVLKHLASCVDCRDIVALSLPAAETMETPVRTAPRQWLTWPGLRWGLVSAGVIAIASLGIVQYEHSAQSRSLAGKTPAPVEVAVNQPAQQSPEKSVPAAPAAQSDNIQPSQNTVSATAPATLDNQNEKKSEAHAGSSRRPLSEPQAAYLAPSPTPAEQLPHGPKVANQWQQNIAQNQAPASFLPPATKTQAGDQAAQAPPPSSEMVEVESAAVQSEAQNKNSEASQIQDLPAVRQPATQEYALARVGKAKAALGGTVNDGPPSSTAAPAASGMVVAARTTSASVPTWSVSSSGALQRSYDQGATWQVVDVNTTRAVFDAVSVQSTTKSSRADSKDAQALKRDSASPTFRAVAVNGADVWAGGSHAALYHSRDAGDHWTRVVPASAGAVLTGDIVSLEFADTQHGKVFTSTAENWITSDGGQTWQKQ